VYLYGVSTLTGDTPMKTPTTPKKISNKRIAAERELDCLKSIGTHGWLTTRYVGLSVWRDSSEHVAVNKSQLVLKRLEAKREVLKRPDCINGIAAWVLTKRGADRVNTILESEGLRGFAHHGHDVGLMEWSRTLLVVDYLTAKARTGKIAGVVGAAGIRAGIGGDSFKDCDGLYFSEDQNNPSAYTVVGVLGVTNARDGIQAKLKRLLKQNIKIDLAGDARIIATLRERIKR
jgi:hypothetical protein